MIKNLEIAKQKAWEFQALTYPNPPVGALITNAQGEVLAKAAHEYAGGPHAEVNAIKIAYMQLSDDYSIKELTDSHELHEYIKKNHKNFFKTCFIYVTLEPCSHIGKTPPCTELIEELGFMGVYIGMLELNKEAAGGASKLQEKGLHVEVAKEQKSFRTLIEPFLCWQKKEPFVFFKLAMSANAVITGGAISSEDSRKHMHQIRDKIDLLVIGGNTVRVDRPTLDARLCDGKAPDILIYSHSKDFDRTIPLFQIPGRKVYIESSLEKIAAYSFVMIEGGQGMLDACSSMVDWYLVYKSPYERVGEVLRWPIKKEPLFTQQLKEDRLTWYKKSV